MSPQTFCTSLHNFLLSRIQRAQPIILCSKREKTTRGDDKTATVMMIGSKVVFFFKRRDAKGCRSVARASSAHHVFVGVSFAFKNNDDNERGARSSAKAANTNANEL